MKKKWLIASYKSAEAKRLETNLAYQEFDYYLPKITTIKNDSSPAEEILFPGYIFISSSDADYHAIKYTKGIKNIIKFGENIPFISEEELKEIRNIEKLSKIKPITLKFRIGQEAKIAKGSLKGIFVKICSLPSKDRAEIFFYFLGSKRRATIPKKDLIF